MVRIKSFLFSVKWLFKELFFKGWLSLFLFFLLGFFQSISILLLIPLISVSDTSESFIKNDNYLVQKTRYFLEYFQIPLNFEVLLLFYIGIIILYSLLKYYSSILNDNIGQTIENRIRKQLHHSYIDMEWINITKIKSSDILGTIIREVNLLASFISKFIQFFGIIIMIIFQLGIAFFISPQVTFIVLATAGLMILLQRKLLFFSINNGRRSIKYSEAFQNNLVEHFQNIKLSKSQGLDSNQKKTLELFSNDIYSNRIEFAKNRARLGLIYDIGTAIVICIFLYIGFVIISIPVTDLILLIIVFSRILPGVKSGIEKLQSLLNMAPGINQIYVKLNTFTGNKEQIDDIPITPLELKSEITVNHISFGYSADQVVLSDVSMVIKKNTLVAITGASGCGKTTLADMLTGLLKPETGNIMLDGKDLQKIGYAHWRKNIAYMTQERLLFHDTIRNNMLWSNPNASEQDIWEALKKANAAEYVWKLKLGIDTLVGDRGTLLSGGQKQRIALAMTLVRKPTLLILDEATNELDEENEKEILEEIVKLKESITIIIITHRTSTMKIADQALVFKDGKISNFVL